MGDKLLADVNTVALYFGNSHSASCQEFTPILKAVYEKFKTELGTEVIFIPNKKDSQSNFEEYCKTMPWPISPFGKNDHLQEYFEDEGIPSLILLNKRSGAVHNRCGVAIAEHYYKVGNPLKEQENEELTDSETTTRSSTLNSKTGECDEEENELMADIVEQDLYKEL